MQVIFRLGSEWIYFKGQRLVPSGPELICCARFFPKGVSISGDLGFLVPHQHVVFLLEGR